MLGVISAAQGNFEDAAACFSDCAKAAPNDPGIAANLAQSLLETGAHTEALPLFKKSRRLAGKADDGLKVFRNADIDPATAARGEPYVATLDDVLVETGYWAVHRGDEVYFRETANLNPQNSPFIKGRIDRGQTHAVVDEPQADGEIDTPCILLGGDENYAHWLLRYLMRLALLENRPEFSGLPFLTIDSLQTYQRDSLEALGIGEDRLIAVPRHRAFRCRRLVVPVTLRTNGTAMKTGIMWLRSRFLGKDLPLPAEAPRRIFVSRRDAPSRHLSNEAEVLEALAPMGVQPVELSRYGFLEQVALFAQAEIVVAPHGAGLANMAFAPEGCPLVELVSDPLSNMNDFRVISDLLAQPLTVIPSLSHRIDPGATNPAAQHSFTTDPERVAATVSEFLS